MTATAKNKRLRVGIIGAGNVATHIATALATQAEVVQIYAPHMETARRLADRIHTKATDSLPALDTDVDCIIISIKDDAVSTLIDDINRHFTPQQTAPVVWMHTAGSVDMRCFSASMPHHGILYPLQTFSRDVPVDIRSVPFFIEASDPESMQHIAALAEMLSNVVRPLDSESRRRLHAAAVLACNMPMFLWSLAHDVLQANHLDFDVMRPLLEVTLDKAMRCNPAEVMTGPARRGDTATIAAHLHELPPQAANVYAFLSNEILKMFDHQTIKHPYEQN